MNQLLNNFKVVLEVSEEVRELRYFRYQVQLLHFGTTEHLSKSTLGRKNLCVSVDGATCSF